MHFVGENGNGEGNKVYHIVTHRDYKSRSSIDFEFQSIFLDLEWCLLCCATLNIDSFFYSSLMCVCVYNAANLLKYYYRQETKSKSRQNAMIRLFLFYGNSLITKREKKKKTKSKNRYRKWKKFTCGASSTVDRIKEM